MFIKLNGKPTETTYRTVRELRAHDFQETDLTIVNGFQISTDYELKEQDEIFIISKGGMPPADQLEAMMASRHTPKVHERLKKGRVAIAGLGGLGSNIAVSLARIGVGHLFLVDFDIVEPSNLNRQSYYVRHLGMPKTEALREQLREINPFIEIKIATQRIDRDNAVELFKEYPIVCEAFDRAESKAMLADVILEKLPGTKLVCASGMAGYDSSNRIQTKKITNNFYLCGDFESEAQIGRGLMAPRVQICAGHQANMVLRLLLDIEEA